MVPGVCKLHTQRFKVRALLIGMTLDYVARPPRKCCKSLSIIKYLRNTETVYISKPSFLTQLLCHLDTPSHLLAAAWLFLVHAPLYELGPRGTAGTQGVHALPDSCRGSHVDHLILFLHFRRLPCLLDDRPEILALRDPRPGCHSAVPLLLVTSYRTGH